MIFTTITCLKGAIARSREGFKKRNIGLKSVFQPNRVKIWKIWGSFRAKASKTGARQRGKYGNQRLNFECSELESALHYLSHMLKSCT